MRVSGLAIEEFGGKETWKESEEKCKDEQEDTNEASLEEEGEEFVLDDLFGAVNMGDKTVLIECGAGTTETDAKKDTGRSEWARSNTRATEYITPEGSIDTDAGVSGGGEPGVESGTIKI